jgi:hypothetical protein
MIMICDAPIIADEANIPVLYDLKIRFLGSLLCKLAIISLVISRGEEEVIAL